MKCKIRTQNKSIYRPRDTEKTAKLSSQVSPENILHTRVSRHVQFSEVIKIEKKNKGKKSTKTKKEDINWMRPKAFSSI